MTPREKAIEERKAFVLANHKKMTSRDMAEHCGVATSCIESLRAKMRLKKSDNPRPLPWTPEQTKNLKLLYASHSNRALATLFGRSLSSISAKGASLSLNKSKVVADRLPEAPKLVAERSPSIMASPRVYAGGRDRITYTPETLPYKARAMAQPWTPPSLSYRGQVTA